MTHVDPVIMGERIKKQRLLNGYSREKLAEMADITIPEGTICTDSAGSGSSRHVL